MISQEILMNMHYFPSNKVFLSSVNSAIEVLKNLKYQLFLNKVEEVLENWLSRFILAMKAFSFLFFELKRTKSCKIRCMAWFKQNHHDSIFFTIWMK